MPSTLIWNGEQVKRELMKKLSIGIGVACEDIIVRVKALMGPKGPNPPSAEHHPPARQTSNYYNSIRRGLADVNGMVASGSVYSSLRYGLFLEKGTRRMAARSHFAIIERSPSARASIVKTVAKVASM